MDAVAEIVERAQKELVIEKQLVKFEETWSSLNLEFQPFPDSEVVNIVVNDLIAEALENDNLALQNLGGSKYVQGNPKFQEMVTDWQSKLGTVDSVLTVWADVSKKWSMLESVFVGSADIRVQLPEDSKRFDGVNADFQGLMKDAPDVLNCVEACNMEGRLERLESMLGLLEQCEKALQDYLETKRIAFPRFYFVAPADLLDILSKGTNPQLILRHLSKCFDNIHNLSFTLDEKGNPSKTAISMWSERRRMWRLSMVVASATDPWRRGSAAWWILCAPRCWPSSRRPCPSTTRCRVSSGCSSSRRRTPSRYRA